MLKMGWSEMVRARGFRKNFDLLYDLLSFLAKNDAYSVYYVWKHFWDKISYETLLYFIKILCEYDFLKSEMNGRRRRIFITNKGKKMMNLLKR